MTTTLYAPAAVRFEKVNVTFSPEPGLSGDSFLCKLKDCGPETLMLSIIVFDASSPLLNRLMTTEIGVAGCAELGYMLAFAIIFAGLKRKSVDEFLM